MSTEIESMIERFRHMVERDGGELTVVTAGPDAVRVQYRAADAAPECADGACMLPQPELEQLMAETFARKWPGMRVEVQAAR